MRLNRCRLLAAGLGWVGLLISLCPAQAFDNNAHANLSDRAAFTSSLDVFLKNNLGFVFQNGIDHVVVNGKLVRELIVDGALGEDQPDLWRPRHHFHNPRLPWGQAGWLPPPYVAQLGQSSILWSQNPDQTVGGKHSWKDARDSYYEALTATTVADRMLHYGETFKSLGYLIHLVQDAAVPSHTRNDTHISLFGIGNADGFHGWAETQTGVINSTLPSVFDLVGD